MWVDSVATAKKYGVFFLTFYSSLARPYQWAATQYGQWLVWQREKNIEANRQNDKTVKVIGQTVAWMMMLHKERERKIQSYEAFCGFQRPVLVGK